MFDPFPGERSRARQDDISRSVARNSAHRESRGHGAPNAKARAALAMARRLRGAADRLEVRWSLEVADPAKGWRTAEADSGRRDDR